MKLYLDAAMAIGPDFLARLAHHGGRLRARDTRLGRALRGTERHGQRKRGKAVAVALVACAVRHVAQHMLGIELGARVAGQGEAAAGRKRAAATVAADRLFRQAQRLHAALGQHLAGVAVGVAARIFVDAPARVPARARRQRRRRRHEIEVAAGIARRHGALFRIAAIHEVHPFAAAAHAHAHGLRQPLARRIGFAAVEQHQRVAGLAMLKAVIDALLLHQPRNEGIGALAILHAILARRIAARQAVTEIRVAEFAEQAGDDLGHRLLLEDARINLQRQPPEPGP